MVKKQGPQIKQAAITSQKKRVIVSQQDIPTFSLSKALRVAEAIHQNYGKEPAKPLWVAQAMNVSPSSSQFKMITGASIAYGLTEGGYDAAMISLTALARRILSPKAEGDDAAAKREATLKPRIISTFLQKYDDSPLPSATIAMNVLEDMGVPRERVKPVYDLIVESAEHVGFFKTIKDKRYIDLHGTAPKVQEPQDETELIEDSDENQSIPESAIKPAQPAQANNRVFITHGKNQTFIEPIRKLLSFGGFEAVVAAEKQTISQPVPDKVMDAMRSCGAAIIHIDAEQKLIDSDAKEHTVLNPNVLIEIGAAMALYRKRFILLVREGVQLPSNLQGLYEVRYLGDKLDSDVTIPAP
jgi:predicted nucleotide-binding protein with TIR-like domain